MSKWKAHSGLVSWPVAPQSERDEALDLLDRFFKHFSGVCGGEPNSGWMPLHNENVAFLRRFRSEEHYCNCGWSDGAVIGVEDPKDPHCPKCHGKLLQEFSPLDSTAVKLLAIEANIRRCFERLVSLENRL